MPRTSCALIVSRLSLLAALLLLNRSAVAQTVWSGLTKSFTKVGGTDETMPENQDPLTTNVVFTRGSSGGLINIAAESSYDSLVSPTGTKWATDLNNVGKSIVATNHSNLAFTEWIDSYNHSGSHGSFIAGRDAVVYLVSDNVYLDLRFTSWETGGGSFAYMRAEPPAAPSPTGDYNGNQVVDAADYVVWRDTLTQSADPFGSGADGNANGTIDPGDYTFWRQNFGNMVAGSATGGSAEHATVVPEPATIILLLVGLLSFQRLAGQIRRVPGATGSASALLAWPEFIEGPNPCSQMLDSTSPAS